MSELLTMRTVVANKWRRTPIIGRSIWGKTNGKGMGTPSESESDSANVHIKRPFSLEHTRRHFSFCKARQGGAHTLRCRFHHSRIDASIALRANGSVLSDH